MQRRLTLFKKTLAKLSLSLLLAVFLFPAGRLQAQSSGTDPGTDSISGTDPQPTGEPRPKVVSTDPSMFDELMFELSMWV
jgi:hypothetical protein